MCAQPCKYVKNQCIVHFKEVNFMVPELRFINNLNSLGSLATELVAMLPWWCWVQGILKACFERGLPFGDNRVIHGADTRRKIWGTGWKTCKCVYIHIICINWQKKKYNYAVENSWRKQWITCKVCGHECIYFPMRWYLLKKKY